jgi:hypothetical protein
MRFELDENLLIVLASDSARTSTPQILEDYCIAHDRSQNLRDSTMTMELNGSPNLSKDEVMSPTS